MMGTLIENGLASVPFYQEEPSVYFNNILRADVRPLTVDQLPKEVIDDFNDQVMDAFGPKEGEITVRRLRYLVPYILQSIDWNEYGMPLEAWQIQYYYHRKRFLEKTHLSFEAYMDHGPLQSAIKALGLEAAPTFEFILFLKYYFGLRSNLRFSSFELLEQARKAAVDCHTASVDICIDGKHFKIDNSRFIKEMLAGIDSKALNRFGFNNDFSHGSSRDKIRALDYFMIKTLLDYLPIRRSSTREGRFSQMERNFGLSVLSLCGRLPDIDREGECSKENNATFDKLMRDFSGERIPFAMELFL